LKQREEDFSFDNDWRISSSLDKQPPKVKNEYADFVLQHGLQIEDRNLR